MQTTELRDLERDWPYGNLAMLRSFLEKAFALGTMTGGLMQTNEVSDPIRQSLDAILNVCLQIDEADRKGDKSVQLNMAVIRGFIAHAEGAIRRASHLQPEAGTVNERNLGGSEGHDGVKPSGGMSKLPSGQPKSRHESEVCPICEKRAAEQLSNSPSRVRCKLCGKVDNVHHADGKAADGSHYFISEYEWYMRPAAPGSERKEKA